MTYISNIEDATKFLINRLRMDPVERHNPNTAYGYDLYLPYTLNKPSNDEETLVMPYLYEAAWELCRKGILRPGVKNYREQSTSDGSAGNGYSITTFGKQWLSECDLDNFVPTEPERFAQMIAKYTKYGDGFHQRSQEAIRCYGAHAYLACCAMCGAAAESILLKTAIAIDGDEENVLKKYKSANGTKKVKDIIQGKAKGHIKNIIDGPVQLLAYWRNESAHGQKSPISETDAFLALTILLKAAKEINCHKTRNRNHVWVLKNERI